MRVLVACEYSGRVREAFRARGHEAYSCDLLPSEDDSKYHIIDDALAVIKAWEWDLMIAHPPCTYLANSGVHLLYKKHGKGLKKIDDDRWKNMEEGAKFFASLLQADIPKVAIENPIMHGYAKTEIGLRSGRTIRPSFVQPWWFGDKAFKATGFTLKGLTPIKKPATALVPPKPGTPEHAEWTKVIANQSPGPDRWKNRSRTFPGIARAIAETWG